jgi:hypothetical protein
MGFIERSWIKVKLYLTIVDCSARQIGVLCSRSPDGLMERRIFGAFGPDLRTGPRGVLPEPAAWREGE